MGIPEKIRAIEDEIHKTQINKATEYHVGLLKAKIARLRRELEENTHGKILSTGDRNSGFDIKKTGDATVVLIGLPSVGKSTLLNCLTNSKSRVASYQFTTLTAVPGILDYCGARIQMLDMPGIIEGASAGRGLGKRVLSVARNADLLLVILDVFQPQQHVAVLKKELSQIGIKMDQKQPDVILKKTSTGGLSINIQAPIKIKENLIREIMRIYGIHSGQITIREPGLTDEQLIDILTGNRVYIPSLIVLNKIDLVNQGFVREVETKIGDQFIPISADANINIDALKEAIYQKLNFIRIYMRPKNGETDFKEPMIVRNGSTVEHICNKIHRNMRRDFRFAYLWGKSAKFDGQKVGLDHRLLDEDILTIIKKVNAI
jgi:small GTP-binding protein